MASNSIGAKMNRVINRNAAFRERHLELAFLASGGKTARSFMQVQDATTVYFLKLWPWIEENKKGLIAGTVIVIVVGFFFWFSSVQRVQKAIAAGDAMTAVLVSAEYASPDAYLTVAAEHSGTLAAQRALLQGATLLYDQGKYTEAQTQFQNFLDANPGSEFDADALLGSAACLDAEGKGDLAVSAYQRVINSSSQPQQVNAANFGIATIDDAEGKLNDALVYYENVASEDPMGSLGSEARQRLMDLRSQMPAASTASPPAAPFTSSH